MTPGGAEAYYERVGTPIDSHVPPVQPGHRPTARERDEEIISSVRAELDLEIAAGRVAAALNPAVAARQIAALIECIQLAWLYDDSVDMAANLEEFMQLIRIPRT
jgi:hypothetical protein